MSLRVNYRYRQRTDRVRRKHEAVDAKRNFPAKIPLVVGRATRSDLPELEGDRYLFPANATVGDLIQFINNKVERAEEAPLFLYVKNEIVVSSASTMAELYQEYREDDFFLYLAYFEENIHRDLPVLRPVAEPHVT